jgi:hypothetical protein
VSDPIEQLAAMLGEHCKAMDTAHVGANGFEGITCRYNPPRQLPPEAPMASANESPSVTEARERMARVRAAAASEDAATRWTVFTCFGRSDGPTLEAALDAHIGAIPDVLAGHLERVRANHDRAERLLGAHRAFVALRAVRRGNT